MKNSECAALRVMSRESKNNPPIDPMTILNEHHDLSRQNYNRVLYKTNTKFSRRRNIEQVIFFVNSETAYSVDVAAVGVSGETEVPAGFYTTKSWEEQESKSWLALDGEWLLIDPSKYRLDSNPKKSLVQTFTGSQVPRIYVHEV